MLMPDDVPQSDGRDPSEAVALDPGFRGGDEWLFLFEKIALRDTSPCCRLANRRCYRFLAPRCAAATPSLLSAPAAQAAPWPRF